MKAEDFVWVDLDEITTLPGPGFHHVNLYRDYWWIVNDKRQVAFFQKKWRSPQCNYHKSLVERAVKNIPGARNVVLLPVAYLKPSS